MDPVQTAAGQLGQFENDPMTRNDNMTNDNMTDDTPRQIPSEFAPWVKYFAADHDGAAAGAIVVFPHAGGSAASYRELGTALAAGGDTFIVQYPQRTERINDPPADTVQELASGLFAAGPWDRVAPLRLFGHSMGAVVAFEFARVAEEHHVAVEKLCVSAGPAPAVVAELHNLPTSDDGLCADLVELGGIDPQLLDDQEFRELVLAAARCDYRALNQYECGADARIRANIDAVGGAHDERVDTASLRRWAGHTQGVFSLKLFDGGHFYVHEHVDNVAARVISDV